MRSFLGSKHKNKIYKLELIVNIFIIFVGFIVLCEKINDVEKADDGNKSCSDELIDNRAVVHIALDSVDKKSN